MTYEHAVSDGQLYDRHFARIRPRSTTIVRLRRGISGGENHRRSGTQFGKCLILQWWARQDSNLQPDRYERPALTIELQAPPRDGRIGSGRQRCAVRLQGWRRGCNPQAFSSEAAAGPRRGKRVKQRALIEAERRGCVESVAHRLFAGFGIIVFCHCLARRVKWPPRSSSRCLSFRFPNPL